MPRGVASGPYFGVQSESNKNLGAQLMEQEILSFAARFAREGYYVFPFYESSKGPQKPFGWARNNPADVPKEKIIPATNDPEIVKTWPELVSEGYNGSKLAGYGVLGLDCVIFDLDNKNGKNGSEGFLRLQKQFELPKAEFVVKSKSGGYHLYYARPAKLRSLAIKTVANLSVMGSSYEGVDVRGDGGMVVGPLFEGSEESWEPGRYQIIKGDPSVVLTEVEPQLAMAMARSAMNMEAPIASLSAAPESMDELDMLKRGEIPPRLSNGNRNNGFYLYLNALKNKGFSVETARKYVQELIKVTDDPDTLTDSVDVEDMLSRIWKIDSNNPYDVCRDLIDSGLYRLTAYRNKLMYVVLKDNPYIESRSPHDLPSMKQLMARHARKMVTPDGKSKVINPADTIDAFITPDQEVSTMGFKPGAPEVFTLTEAYGGRKYLNTWSDPRKHIDRSGIDAMYWEKFRFIVGRIFGPEGSTEYQLGLDFPAWILQNPGVKPVVAPFIMSRVRGAGKSMYLWLLSQIFGYNLTGELQARQYKVDEIEGRFFNPAGSSLLIFDEVQFPMHRNMRQESSTFWKHLKPLVTQDTIPVEYKGGDVGVQQPNFAGILMAGNTGNNFPVEEFDRRIWLIDNDPPELEEGVVDEFFAMQKNQLSKHDKRKILNSLLDSLSQHKIALPLDRMRAPMNDIKREMFHNTLADLDEFWLTYFEDVTNLMARSPVHSRSSILYLISISDRLAQRWREEPEGTFRELKRRGLIHPIRTRGNNYQTRNIRGIPIVTVDGRVIQEGEGRDVLYTARNHGEMNGESNDSLFQSYLSNINAIGTWKKSLNKSKTTQIAGSLTG